MGVSGFILVLIHIPSFLSNTLNIIFSLTTIIKSCQKVWIVSHLSESFDVPVGCMVTVMPE